VKFLAEYKNYLKRKVCEYADLFYGLPDVGCGVQKGSMGVGLTVAVSEGVGVMDGVGVIVGVAVGVSVAVGVGVGV
jgi:hypothetical protein